MPKYNTYLPTALFCIFVVSFISQLVGAPQLIYSLHGQLFDSSRITQMADAMDRQQQQQWGPSLHKVSWAELCKRESSKDPNNAKKITGDGGLPIFMSSQLQSQMGTCNFREKDVLLKLRPVDALHIPHLRVDDAGKKL